MSCPGLRTENVVDETTIAIQSDADIVRARQAGREQAMKLGFSLTEATLIATAISELARNIVQYAGRGSILLRTVQRQERAGIVIMACDQGPGIADIKLATQNGFSTSRSLGMGLPGVRRLVDDFEIESQIGQGTVVTIKKWVIR